MRTFLLVAVVGAAAWLAGARMNTQEARQAQEAAMAVPAMPTPTAEHRTLQDRVGVWDADCKLFMGPEAMLSKATMTYESFGDFWVLGRFEGEFMGEAFEGLEIGGYDPESGEYISMWLDNTSPEFTEMRGEWQTASKSMTMQSTKPGTNHLTGQKETMVQELEMQDADTMVFKMRPESASSSTMEIVYHRRK